jgi:hypothetical protein
VFASGLLALSIPAKLSLLVWKCGAGAINWTYLLTICCWMHLPKMKRYEKKKEFGDIGFSGF